VILAAAFLILMVARVLRGGADTAGATPYDVICPACGYEATMKLKSWPFPKCPKCGKARLEIAAVCPVCGRTEPMKDSRAFWENPYGALRSGEVLPVCPEHKRRMTSKIAWRLQREELRRMGVETPQAPRKPAK